MIIKNARILSGKKVVYADISFDDKILDIGDINGAGWDACGKYIVPGLVDVHTHGAGGNDFCDASRDGFAELSKWYALHGTTSFMATTMTISTDRLLGIMEQARDFDRPVDGARCIGIHLEGPFISGDKCGAQAQGDIRPADIDEIIRLNDKSGGRIRMITAAPETDGAMDFIKKAAKLGITVSIGHTSADYDTAVEAFKCGASHLTHSFNAMSPMLHRAPGPVAAAFDCGAYAEIIADGCHLHPAVVRMMHRLFTDRINLISDSSRCAGMPDGEYELGGQAVVLKGGEARIAGSDTIAGSSISLLDAVKNSVKWGIPLEEAVYAASAAPAMAVGMCGAGLLVSGADADLLVLDEDLNLEAVFVAGRQIVGNIGVK